MRQLHRPAFTLSRSDSLKPGPGFVKVNDDDDDALTIHFDRYDGVVIGAELARVALEAIVADQNCDGVSDEASTRAEARGHLQKVIQLATTIIRTLDEADAEEGAPREPDHSDIGRVMAEARGENAEMYP